MRLPQDEKLQAIDEDKITEKDVPVDTSETSVVGNKQWTVIPFPINYLPSNWPIRVSKDQGIVVYLLSLIDLGKGMFPKLFFTFYY